MFKPIFVIVFLLSVSSAALAQEWDVSLGAGLPFTRIFRMGETTRSTAYLHFGFMGPGSYLNPEVSIKLSEQGHFLFDYQLSNNRAGIQFGGNTKEENYDFFTLHTFCVGYKHQFTGFKGKARFALLGKAGITYGYNTGGGYGSTGGSSRQQAVYVQIQGIYDAANVMPPFWMPVLAGGITAGPVIAGKPALADRLDISLIAVLGLKDMYADYAQVKYAIATPSSYEDGIAKYRGRPLTLQMGIKYRLFRVVRER